MKAVADFSDRFRELIEGESYAKVGEAIGVSKQTISAYANGERSPKKPTIQVIALYYGVSPAWLIGLDVPKYIEKPASKEEGGLSVETIELLKSLSKADQEIVFSLARQMKQREIESGK